MNSPILNGVIKKLISSDAPIAQSKALIKAMHGTKLIKKKNSTLTKTALSLGLVSKQVQDSEREPLNLTARWSSGPA